MRRVTVITGASSGIGAALAERFARDGDAVVLMARRIEALHQVAERVVSAGGTALPIAVDVADHDAVKAAFVQVEAQVGPVDLLIANAGIGDPTPAKAFDATRVERIIRVNLLGPTYCIEAILPSMLARGRGHIVGVGSLAGYRGLAGSGAYCASKAGLASLLESLRIECRPKGVAVSTICPGFIKTPLTERNRFKMPFILEVDDAAERIYRAVLRGRREYAFPWQLAAVVRLARFLPNAVYDRLAGSRPADKVPLPKS